MYVHKLQASATALSRPLPRSFRRLGVVGRRRLPLGLRGCAKPQRRRSGNVLVLTLLLLVALLGVVAFAVDLGYLLVARTELQLSADAAALAGAWELIDQDALSGDASMTQPIAAARATAQQFAGLNTVCTTAPSVDANEGNSEDGEVVIGKISSFHNPNAAMTFDDPSGYNAVKVSVRRTASQNGLVPAFFSRILGSEGAPAEARATAGFLKQAAGFRSTGGNVNILPFALDLQTWNQYEQGQITADNWSWDEVSGSATSEGDGVPELDLYPQATGSPGNRGTVNIGANNNSTSRVARQILEGITAEDLDFHGGSLAFGDEGTLELGANPGISAGFKDELEAIKGQPRVIPIFSQIAGNGGNAQYTIVKFVGIRIVDVQLTGGSKHLMVQPAVVVMKGLIPPSEGSSPDTLQYVYSPPYLIH